MSRPIPVALCLLAIAIVCGAGARAAAADDKEVLTHDESISFLAATCHEGAYDRMLASGARPLGRWVPAASWQRFLRMDDRFCFRMISRDLSATDIHPPAYFWLLHAWGLAFGLGPATGAWLDGLIDLATLLALFGFGLRVLRRPVPAAAVALVWALSPAVVPIGSEARQCALFALSTVLLAWALDRALEDRPSPGRAAALAGASALGMLAHYQFALVLAGAGVAALVAARRGSRRGALWALGAMAAGTLAAAALHPGFLESFAREQAQTSGLAEAGLDHRLGRVARTLAGGIVPGSLLPTPLAVVIVGVVVAGTAVLAVRSRGPRRRVVLLAAWVAGSVIAMYLVGASHGEAMGAKYLAAAWPLLAFLPVLAARRVSPAVAATGVAAIVALGITAGLQWRSPDRPAAARVLEGAQRVAVDTDRRGELLRITLLLPPRTPVLAPDRRSTSPRSVRARVRVPEVGEVLVSARTSHVRVDGVSAPAGG